MRNVWSLQSRRAGTQLSRSLVRPPFIPLPTPSAISSFSSHAITNGEKLPELEFPREKFPSVSSRSKRYQELSLEASITFTPVRAALKAPSQDLGHYLDLIPTKAFENRNTIWSQGLLLDLLRLPADQASLLRLIPIIWRYIEHHTLKSGAKVAVALLRQIRLLRILPLVPTLVDVVIARVELAVEKGEVERTKAMEVIGSFLQELKRFRFQSTFTKSSESTSVDHVPPHIDTQVYRLASLAITITQSTPSSSTSLPIISPELRELLFGKAFLTPQLMHLLLGHIPKKDITVREWRACAYHILKEGGVDAEKRSRIYLLLARKASTVRTGSRFNLKNATSGAGEDDDGGVGIVESRAIMSDIDRITLARCGGTAHSVLQTLQPYLDSPPLDTDGVSDLHPDRPAIGSYAWSILLQRLSKSPDTSTNDLLDLAHDLTPNLIVPEVMTPIITGLAARGDMKQAWALWTDLANHEKEGKTPGRFVDRYLLAAITPVCAHLYGPDSAVKLVDNWARRAKGISSGNWTLSISLDPVNLQALLLPYVRKGLPSVPLRLLEAALPRWGIWPDHISLNLVLDSCRFASSSGGTGEPSIQSRLKDVLGEFRIFKPKNDHPRLAGIIKPEEYAGKAEGRRHRILLDPKGASWRDMMGATRPWEFARQIFQDVIFGNWPYLSNIKSPLLFGTFGSLSTILAPQESPSLAEKLPLPTARYTHILPTSSTFQSYITLLGYYRQTEEIPTALAWARELGIEPNWKSMCSALAFIGDVEGPRRRVAGWYDDGGAAYVRDEEVLRRWLENWVKGDVPTEGEVAAFVKTVRDKGGRMTASSGWGQSE